MTAPGRYCLAICYCGDCPHYVPIIRTADRDDLDTRTKPKKKATSTWETREEPTWIDHL